MGTKTAIQKKSVFVSGLLSLLLGPFGWLYAAPWKSAVLGAAAWTLAVVVLPQVIVIWLAMLVLPASAVAGVVYALGHNVIGERTPLFGKSKEPAALPAKR